MLSYTSAGPAGSYTLAQRHTFMIVALDATPLTVSTGGIRRYTEMLSSTLAETFPNDHFWLISDQVFSSLVAANLHRGSLPASRRWWSFGLPRELSRIHADVFHGTDFSVPYLPTRPSVLTLHDLSPWKAGSVASQRVRRRTPLLLRAGIPTMIITPSEAIRHEAIVHFGLNPDRVVAIPLAASPCFRQVEVQTNTKPYFLFVGTREPRKNLPRLLEAWNQLKKTREVELVLVGASGFTEEPGLRTLAPVTDDALSALYSGAAALVYPSLYEGFGLPVLEAMQCGTPVITSRDPAIMEVTGGTGAIHIDANSTDALVTAMHCVLTNPQQLREQALQRARQFSWQWTAQRTREVYEQAIRLFSHA